ncbi:uncharacterized protein LOC121500689 isoform X3 [Vulpes lagopus]|uniref:uncharacterized protein LOC121500689 isoform X3 n=1 Tax=Vulpes lagopus TaxID=494514 RepID=UPI001BC94B6A|nr:uncharacterized protein LOC121500689 isoform X3 [Vulpes lagopus]
MTDSLPQRRLFCYLETHAHLFDFGSKLLSSQSDWASCKTLECPSAVGCGMSLLSGDYGSISTLHAQDLHLFFQECLTGCPLQIHQMCHLFHHVVIPGIIIEHPSPPLWSMDGCSLLSIPPNVLNTVRRGKRLMELLSLSMTAKMNPKKPKSLSMSDLPAACHTHLKPQGNECGSGGGKSANQMPGCWKPVILSEHLPCPAQRFKTNFPTDRQLSTSTGHEGIKRHYVWFNCWIK